MASILEEYEDSLSRSNLSSHSRAAGIPLSGYVNARLEKETPIFNKQRIDFTPPENINSLVVCSNQLCMSLGKDAILRIDLVKADQPNQADLGRKDDFKVHKMFLDPTDLPDNAISIFLTVEDVPSSSQHGRPQLQTRL